MWTNFSEKLRGTDMRHIKKFVEHIEEEIEGATNYAEKAVEFKAKGDMQTAAKYKSMAEDELRHAMTIHEMAVKEINDLSKIVTPPVEMMEKWEHAHKKFVEQVAWVKQMLSI
jgi:ferritin